MRTRRSPRNQDIMWRALDTTPAAPARQELTLEDEITRLENILSKPLTGGRTRRMYERDLAKVQARLAVRQALAQS